MQYCSLQHWNLLSPLDTFTTMSFPLGPASSFFLELFPSNMLDTYRPRGLIFQCHIFLTFHTVHGVLKARMLMWIAIPFCSGPCFVTTLHHDPSVLGCLHGMVHGFTELHEAVIHVVILVTFLWLSSVGSSQIRLPPAARDTTAAATQPTFRNHRLELCIATKPGSQWFLPRESAYLDSQW